MNSYQNISWKEIEKIVDQLSEKVVSLHKDFSSISTISRGGLVPARLLADRMGIDVILVDKNKIPIDSLFVDDIYDSGNTFKKILPKISDPSNFVYATLFARRGKKYPKHLLYSKKTNGNEYIVFPWDKLEYKRLQELAL